MNTNLNKIAVIGMACRFPGANNINEFWENLIEGRDTIKHFTDEELAAYEYDFESLKNNPDFVKARGILSDIDRFDAEFFGMTPKEAAATDPQHRVWLETAWEALENAGCDPFTFPGAIGVFAGGYLNTYLLNNILRDRAKLENYIRLRTTESFQILTGNDAAFLPTKTAYKFNLRGPAVNVQTACSTSLVAISQACQSLFSFESDVCLAGGICIVVPQESGYLHQAGAIPSPDGKCRPFDANGKGTVFSNGVGVVVLKRIEDAIRDRDTIYAQVRGWALNNDGNNKVSYMAPGVDGQAEAIMMAQSFSEISPEQISYIEAHGTATELGDPIELEALNKAFSGKTTKKQFCGIGSVKSNIGHTDAAAGVASFIKSCLSVYYKIIPPTLNFNKPNPHFDFKNSPFFIQDNLKKWDRKMPLIIGVSSFGIGGTNAHVIIEEPPEQELFSEPEPSWPCLIPLSAKSEPALSARKNDLLGFIKKNPGSRLKDIAYTLQTGRNQMAYRSFCVTEKAEGINSDSFVPAFKSNDHLSGTAFMFSGQGAQYPGMGQDLYKMNAGFRKIMDEGFEIVRSETGTDLKEILFEISGGELPVKKLSRTDLTQPALFIVEYALARLYQDLGIKPLYLIGHSIGEYAAACIAGVFDFKTAVRIVIKRGQLMQSMPAGKMLAVRCSKEKLKDLEGPDFEIAADNADSQCTISFKSEMEDAVKTLMEFNGIQYIQLNTSHAFHSSAFDPIMQEFSRYVNRFRLKSPSIPFISCLTGDFITPDDAVSGYYWSQQLRNTVLFRKGISTIVNREDVLFLEVGPDTHLTGLARQNTDIINRWSVIPSLGKKDEVSERYKILSSVGHIWANGISLNFGNLNLNDSPVKIGLPTYPFQKKRYWIDHVPGNDPVIRQTMPDPIVTSKSETAMETKGTVRALRELLTETSGNKSESIKEDVSFEKMGFDSLFLTQYAQGIERKFRVKIGFRQLISEYPTIKELAGLIDSKLPERPKISLNNRKNHSIHNLVKFQPGGIKDPLIILHGQNADTFIPECLGNEHPYYGFLHPGSDGEVIRFKSVEEMAGAYLDQLLAHEPHGPFYLGGFSFGGVLAFEMAVQLKKMGYEVPVVILFDSFLCPEPFRWYNSVFRIIKSNILVPPAMKVIKFIKSSVCASYIMLHKPTPVVLRPFYIINKYGSLIKTYKPEKYSGKIILFRATENNSSMKYLGWEKHVDDLKVIPLVADHLSILKNAESIKTIQTEIRSLLNSLNNK